MTREGVIEHPTPNAKPVGEVLDALQAQTEDALSEPLADAALTSERAPLMKRMRSEIGSTEVNATNPESDLTAHVAVEVRCDRDEEGPAGRYKVRTEGRISRGSVTTEIPVRVKVDESDGSLGLDADVVREEIAQAVRVTDAQTPPRPRAPKT